MKRTAKKLIQMKYARAEEAKKKTKQNKIKKHTCGGREKMSQNEKRTHRECNACTNNNSKWTDRKRQ